jgi:hypothetical protein
MNKHLVPCPRCDKAMASDMVVCWSCWRATNRLSEDPGIAEFAHYVTVWEDARERRHPIIALFRPSPPKVEETGIFLCEDPDE